MIEFANSVNSVELAHNEPIHLDLHCSHYNPPHRDLHCLPSSLKNFQYNIAWTFFFFNFAVIVFLGTKRVKNKQTNFACFVSGLDGRIDGSVIS